MTWWCNSDSLKYFVRNQLSNLHLIIVSPYAIINKLSTTTASNTSIIAARRTHLTVAPCIYTGVLYLIYIKWLFAKMFLFYFQTKDNNMYAYVDLWHSEDSDRNQQNSQLSNSIHLYCIFILVNKPTHHYNFSLLVRFFRRVKLNQQNNQI